MDFCPNTFMIGAMKAGTTSLAALLEQHPNVCLSSPKETHFFSRDGGMGNQAYKSLFVNPNALITIDASVTYSMLPIRAKEVESWRFGVHERIFNARPDARFIYIMRNPIERAWSAWNHELQTGRQQQSFEQALKQPNSMLIDNGDYLAQIEAWLQFYPIERFRFYEFERFLDDPLTAGRDLIAWLGLPPFPDVPSIEHLNEKMAMGRLGRTLSRMALEMPLLYRVRGKVPREFRQRFRAMMSSGALPEKKISSQVYDLFTKELAPTWPRLSELTGIDTSHWGAIT